VKVAWVTPYLPDERGGGGSAHEFELLRWAVQHHEVEIISSGVQTARFELDVDGTAVPVHSVHWREHSQPRTRAGLAARLALGGPSIDLWVQRGRVHALTRALADHQRERPVDLVHVTMGEIAPVVAAAKAPSVILLFDVLNRQLERELEHAKRRRGRLVWSVQSAKMRRWERRWYSQYGGVACVSAVDTAAVKTLIGRRVEVLPNPVPEAFFTAPERVRAADVVTFVAHLRYRPNVDAVEWLTSEIWPQVRAQHPAARLRVVGKYPTAGVREAVAAAGGELFADVDDVRPFYWETSVAVAPIRLGSGLRNKVIHAMACQAPVVATGTAVEGIALRDGEDALIRTDAASFASAIVETLQNPLKARVRAERARVAVESYRAGRLTAAFGRWWDEHAGTAAVSSARSAPVPLGRRASTATAIVCTRDRSALLEVSLKSVAESVAGRAGVDLLVVEQGDRVAEDVCRRLGVQARVVHDDGTGVSRARNIAMREARGEVVLFTDDDCRVPADWVDAHLDALSDPSVAATFGVVLGLPRDPGADLVLDPVRTLAWHSSSSLPWLIGHSSNMAVRKDAAAALGGFDERIGPGVPGDPGGGEDADFIVRMLDAGFRVRSGVGMPVEHTEWRSGQDSDETLRSYERGAGVWIGKAIRHQGLGALPYLRERVHLLNERVRPDPRSRTKTALELAGALAAGLAYGLRLRPWDGTETGVSLSSEVTVADGGHQSTQEAPHDTRQPYS
jgi:glycosyltransferase involved in cell wall biosynthesis/GT2 family glycosyltransferase